MCARLFTYEKRKTEEFGIQALSDKRKVIFSGSNPFIVGKRADNALGRYYRFSRGLNRFGERKVCYGVCWVLEEFIIRKIGETKRSSA